MLLSEYIRYPNSQNVFSQIKKKIVLLIFLFVSVNTDHLCVCMCVYMFSFYLLHMLLLFMSPLNSFLSCTSILNVHAFPPSCCISSYIFDCDKLSFLWCLKKGIFQHSCPLPDLLPAYFSLTCYLKFLMLGSRKGIFCFF